LANLVDFMLKSIDLPLIEAAWNVFSHSATPWGFTATFNAVDNYKRIWARDLAVTGLAILAHKKEAHYQNLYNGLMLLAQTAHENGQIPSNVLPNQNNQHTVSFGGPVGRTDASFWWIIATSQFVATTSNASLKKVLENQAEKIFYLANCWEFNYKHLMYTPASANWADEYVTEGYVLYDQLLRIWALEICGEVFNNTNWLTKASAIRKAVNKHFCAEANDAPDVFTGAQKKQLENFNLLNNGIASFTPAKIVFKYDAWALGLLLLLKIPSLENQLKIHAAIQNVLQRNGNGVPAFWPIINQLDNLSEALESNYSFEFKNKAGHFHNGGVWPIVNGFVIAGLYQTGAIELAQQIHNSLNFNLQKDLGQYPFAEYYDYYNNQPLGQKDLCYSAAGILLADFYKNKFQNPSQNHFY
jgi:hypothetical protein